eukprot:CAMPEP_0118905836 /NCGR_PEP_ID=MMETSP1166-20130328/9646_1 /TAXON_ID=1104430 /ORGANISM="Chrysoreinhardia sp, Strain CCMP3193" /LENGTH=233 /DNA_ID=CAMNT_0006845107 /DNA_START=28 /DNA_END=729 /DNA_ORIENTATION=+
MLLRTTTRAVVVRRSVVPAVVRTQARLLAISRPTVDEDSMVFPRERPGLDYTLNWSLNGDGVTPYGDAYRLTKKEAAAEMLSGVTREMPAGEATAAPVEEDEDAFEEAFDSSVAILEAAPTLYVAEGDAPSTRVACRVITDDVAVAGAAILNKIVERMPLREARELPVTAYVTPSGDDLALCHYPADAPLALRDMPYTKAARIILSGKHATAGELQASILAAAQELTNPTPDD